MPLLTTSSAVSLIRMHALGSRVLSSDNASWDDKYEVISTHVLHPANQHIDIPAIAPTGDPEADIKLMFASFSNALEQSMRLAADVHPDIQDLLLELEGCRNV